MEQDTKTGILLLILTQFTTALTLWLTWRVKLRMRFKRMEQERVDSQPEFEADITKAVLSESAQFRAELREELRKVKDEAKREREECAQREKAAADRYAALMDTNYELKIMLVEARNKAADDHRRLQAQVTQLRQQVRNAGLPVSGVDTPEQ